MCKKNYLDECWYCGNSLDVRQAVQIIYKGEVYEQVCLTCAIINEFPGIHADNLDASNNWRNDLAVQVIHKAEKLSL